jgi:hypothetical protein
MKPLPSLPRPGPLKSLSRLTASEAEMFLRCALRVVLDRDDMLAGLRPFVAAAALGTAAHAALAAMVVAYGRNEAANTESQTRVIAAALFDEAIIRVCALRDERLAARGELPGDCTDAPTALPFYALTRARFARLAAERFGTTWRAPLPQLDSARRRTTSQPAVRPRAAIQVEVPLQSLDGLIRGVADIIDETGEVVAIEELKSGAGTEERLRSWTFQLLLYARLYLEQHGPKPVALRVRSLASGTLEIPYSEQEAAAAMESVRAALNVTNELIANGAPATELARPSTSVCARCGHRAWCEPYWTQRGSGDSADAEGRVLEVNGWDVTLETSSTALVSVNLKALRRMPSLHDRIRICDARMPSPTRLIADRTTAAWVVS